jgi:AsmA protein
MRAKRILAVAIGLVLLFVVALVIIFGFVFPPAKIAAEVVRRAEAATGFDLGVESAGLGLGRGGLTVKLTKITVQEPTRPEPAMLALDRLDLGVELGPLLRKEVRVTRLVLDRPVLTLVKDAAGRWNVAPRPASGGTPAPGRAPAGTGAGGPGAGARSGGLLLAVPSAEIRHGTLHFTDQGTGAAYSIADLDGRIEAQLEPDTVRIRTDLVLGGTRADLKSGGGAAYGPLTLALRGQVAHAPATGITRMRDLVLELEAIQLQVNGTITSPKPQPGTTAGPPLLDLALTSDRFEPSRVLSLLPASKDLRLAGHAQLAATARGPAAAPEIAGALTLDQVSVTPPGRTAPLLTGLAGEARFTRTTLALSPLTGQFAGSPFELTATLTNFARPEVQGALDLTAQVTDLAALATLPPGVAVEKGQLAVDVNFNTKAPKFAEALRLEGTVRGTGIGARMPGVPVPITDLTFDAKLTGRGGTIEPFRLTAGRSDLGGRLTLARFDAPTLAVALSSRLLDLDELAPAAKPAVGGGGGTPAANAPATGKAAGAPAPRSAPQSGGGGKAAKVGIPAQGTVRANEIRWQKLSARDATLHFTLDQHGLTVDDLRAGLLGGTVTGSLAVDLSEPDSLRYKSNLRASKVQANELVSTFTPARNILYGELDTSLDLAGIKAGELPPLALLTAVGDATVLDGYLAVRGPIAVIMREMGLIATGSDRLDFQKLTTGLRVESGRVRLNDAKLGSARYGDFTLSGSVGVDGTLDYRVHALMPKRYTPPALLEQKALLDLVADANGRLPLDFAVSGSVTNPQVKIDLAALQAQATTRAKQQLQAKGETEVKKATEKAAESAKKTLEGILGNMKRKSTPADTGRAPGQ